MDRGTLKLSVEQAPGEKLGTDSVSTGADENRFSEGLVEKEAATPLTRPTVPSWTSGLDTWAGRQWTRAQVKRFSQAYADYGNDWETIAKVVESHTRSDCKELASFLGFEMDRNYKSRGRAVEAHPEEPKRIEIPSSMSQHRPKTAKSKVDGSEPVSERISSFKTKAEQDLDSLDLKPAHKRQATVAEMEAEEKRGVWWSSEEEKILTDAVSKYGNDWDQVQRLIPSRSQKQCARKARRLGVYIPHHSGVLWTDEENERLEQAMRDHGTDWTMVAKDVRTKSKAQCRRKVEGLGLQADDSNGILWSPEEDDRLVAAVGKFGNSWENVAKMVGSRTLTGCQHRVKVLGLKVEGRKRVLWTPEEEDLLRNAVLKYGNKWALVANEMPNRSLATCRTKAYKMKLR